jgi:hypothetical protein
MLTRPAGLSKLGENLLRRVDALQKIVLPHLSDQRRVFNHQTVAIARGSTPQRIRSVAQNRARAPLAIDAMANHYRAWGEIT